MWIGSAAQALLAGEVAIVVNKDNPINELSLKDLTAIFELRQQFWKEGGKISVIIQESGRAERAVMLSQVYKRTDEELKKFWLGRMFKADISALPTTLSSNESVKRFVQKAPGAIGFMDADAVDGTVKVLRVEGLSPKQEGYPLRSDKRDS